METDMKLADAEGRLMICKMWMVFGDGMKVRE